MGFVSDIIGEVTGANQQAKSLKESANQQAQATRQAAEASANAARESAKQTAAQAATTQAQNAARETALNSANNELNAAPANPDVQLAATTDSAAGASKKRREKFGIGSKDTGVNI